MNNKFTLIFYFAAFFFLAAGFSLSGQQSERKKPSEEMESLWNLKNPFTSEVFIENNGQFNNPEGHALSKVAYGINNRGLKIYFSPTGLHYHVVNIKHHFTSAEEKHEVWEEMEKEIRKDGKLDDRFNKYFTDHSAHVDMIWEGANPDARIEVSEMVPDNYSYSEKNEKGEFQSIIARAYKKLTYKNIYPNIDVEYYFPGNMGDNMGIKYNIVVHPGGDLSQVRMTYNGMDKITMDSNGNVIVSFTDGKITDHTPDLSYAGSEDNRLNARLSLQGSTVSFDVPQYDKTQKLVIDPFVSVWSISPGFTTPNDGYTIRVDYNSNVYVMGGGVNMGGFPFARYDYQVKKFNTAGALQWTAMTQSPNAGLYGDMVVLRSGRAIVGHAFGSMTTMYIINPVNGAVTNVTTLNEPGWRLSYNQVANNNLLWMGGGSNNGAHLYRADTNAAGAVAYNPWGTAGNTEDICYLAQDKTGANVYITNASNSRPNNSTTAPHMCKVASGNPGTALWEVNEPTDMMEAGQGTFINNGAGGLTPGWATGVNGMVVCNDRIYTFDGNNLRSYNPANGALVNQVTVGGTFDKNSGIDVDSCCRVYVGVNGVVKRYSSTLVFDNSFPVTNTVYDLKFDPRDDDILYVTGKGFVQKLRRNTCPTCINATKTDVSGCSLGTGSVTVTDPAATMPLTYSWSNGGTTQSISGLQPGTYIVIVRDNTPGCPLEWRDTIVVTGVYNCGPLVTATGGVICQGNCITISATGSASTGPYTFTWQPGNMTGATANVCPVSTTTYTVIVSDASSQTASTTAVVTVNIPPTVTSTGATICAGNSANISASGAGTYTWQPGGSSSNPYSVSPGATTGYTVTGTDANGCTNTSVAIVTVNPNPVVSTTPQTICIGQSTNLSASGATNYSWLPGGSNNNPFTVNPSSTTTYTLIGSTLGCTGTTTVIVTVNLNATITATPQTICNGQNTTLTASGANNYTWQPGGSMSNPLNITPTSTTTYSITGTTTTGCSGTTTVLVTVNPVPTITSSNQVICKDSTGSLTAGGGTNYTWMPGSGNANPLIITPTAAGTTTYTVTGANSFGCTNTATAVLTVPDCAVPSVTVNNPVICQGQCANLTATGIGGVGTITYTWSPNIGTGAGPHLVCPTVTTSYTVSVSDANGNTDQAVAVVTVNPLPNVTATGSTVCVGSQGTLTANGALTYTWQNGTTPVNGTPVNAGPVSTTTYTVTGTDNNGCSNSSTAVITVNPLPVINAGPDVTICQNTSATLSASGAVNYAWSPVTGLTPANGIGATVTASPNVTTTYTVTGTDANGCSSMDEIVVTVVPLLNAQAGPNASICIGQSVNLSASGGTTYQWAPGTGLNQTTGQTVTASPSQTTTYTVTAISGSCSDDTTVVVTVNPLPVITTTGSTICAGSTGTISASGAVSFTWAPSPNTNGGAGPWICGPLQSSITYTVVGVDNNGCMNIGSAVVTVNPLPIVSAGQDITICPNTSTTLTATGGVSFSWVPAAGLSNPGIANPVASPLATTTYTVIVTDANNCVNTDDVVVTVAPAPVVTANNAGICEGQSVTLNASGATSYTWSPATGLNQTNGSSVSANPAVTTVYTIIGASGPGCGATSTVQVTVTPKPIVNFTPDTTAGCRPLTVTFNNSTTATLGSSCLWRFGDGTTSTQCMAPSKTYNAAGVYSVSLVVTTPQGCSDSLVRNNLITVYPLPTANFTFTPKETEILEPKITIINQSTGDTTWVWDFGDGSRDSITRDPIHVYEDTGHYQICLTVYNSFGCRDQECSEVIIKPVWSFYIPNAFTPNGDGKNEYFTGAGENISEYQMYIYDRWGNLLYETKDLLKGWDGKANGGTDMAQQDVYVYVISFKDVFNLKHQYIGSVTLVK